MIVIKTNKNCITEKNYVFSFIFSECFRAEYKIELHNSLNSEILFNSKKIVLNEVFFELVKDKWLVNDNIIPYSVKYLDLADLPLDINIPHQSMPIIFGESVIKFVDDDEIHIGVDIIGSIFYLLSGYEETQTNKRDSHNRFMSRYSFLSKDNLILRPIVNEYIEFLFAAIKYLIPEFITPNRNFKKLITSDVDQPYNPDINNLRGLLKGFLKYFIKKDYTDNPLNILKNYFYFKFGTIDNDRDYNNFQWMLDINNEKQNKLIFFFLVNKIRNKFDGYYSISEKPIKNLIKRILEHGHEIGIHFSYDTFKNKQKFKEEFREFKKEFLFTSKKSRQHYLRWCSINTPQLLEYTGVKNDFTLGFSDHIGFRSGTCFEHKLYDLINRKSLEIYETPLIVMDVSLYSENYMNIGSKNEIIDLIDQLVKECKHYKGIFSVLWHNNQLNLKEHRLIFEHLIS